MKLLRFSAATIALIGFASAYGQEAADEAPTSAPATVEDARSGLWSDYEHGESSLLVQAQAVFAALRAKDALERGVEIEAVEVTLTDANSGQDSGNCRHMPLPGSRFMTERCFYESNGEAALNDYQYQQEFEQIREQSDLQFLERAQYELEYRKSLTNQ